MRKRQKIIAFGQSGRYNKVRHWLGTAPIYAATAPVTDCIMIFFGVS